MTYSKILLAQIMATVAFASSPAVEAQSEAIKENGIWTDNNWKDADSKIGVHNGEVYSCDDDVDRRIT